MNAIKLFLLVLVHTLLAQAGSDFSTCLSGATYNTLSSFVANIADKQNFCCLSNQCAAKSPNCGLPGDECGGIVGTTQPTNTTVGTCPSYEAIGNALVGSTTASTFNNGGWSCTGSIGSVITDLTRATGGCTLQLSLPGQPVPVPVQTP
ncbi:11402_t:CDS:2 [Gigaspora rosea]|nr:11402_t:CDS:2 [Gigaspora rosea]